MDVIRGELPRIWAGYGGGAGGDASSANVFPTPNWMIGSDEKGGGGGGGGGAIRIRALGRIVIGPKGDIRSHGGPRGATGENTSFLDHVGGTGGSGSGGHVILESATEIDLTDGDPDLVRPPEWISTRGGPRVLGPIQDGGGGMNQQGVSHGGQGGPGVVQLHVPDITTPPSADPATSNIILPLDVLLDPEPLSKISAPTALALVPTFGARSQSRSRWIPVGGADLDAGQESLVEFLFDGIEVTPGAEEGKILTSGARVTDLTPLLGPEPIPSATVEVENAGSTLVVSGSSLTPLRNGGAPVRYDLYLRTPALLRSFLLRVEVPGNTAAVRDFDIADAVYDDVAGSLALTIEPSLALGTIDDFLAANSGSLTEYSLIPRFFRVRTGPDLDRMPDTAFVRILFQATGADASGRPDTNDILVDWTADVSSFNALDPGALKFFRFEVEFQLDSQGTGISRDTTPVSLEFLRLPFRF